MGILFNKNEELRTAVKNDFSTDRDYLIVSKYNSTSKSLLKMFISNLWGIYSSSRTFILYFNVDGIYIKEISTSMKSKFNYHSWCDIKNFKSDDKGNKAIISFNYLQKEHSYEVPFDNTKYLKDNKKRYYELNEKDFYM
ncbi:histidine kinase [Helcococcus ovis]|uniref:histidine kinase n=1 Tax=Helcococcus ovis TaxID=72026 RepID=UPI0010701273|nr:histidine kinase [Helcococcus ovis]TFF66704.1 histidine kinase [Helcococcus ovis]WNZ00845.1 histidine kinase [Helcococcus ovis]